jgi:hypothetical protein
MFPAVVVSATTLKLKISYCAFIEIGEPCTKPVTSANFSGLNVVSVVIL